MRQFVTPMQCSRRTAVVAAAAAPSSFRVVTYNLLANKYALGGWHQYCDPAHLQWDYRRSLLQQELQSYEADIVCLQEVEKQVFAKELQPWFQEQGLRGHFLARQHGEMHGPPEGVALFIRDTMFETLDTKKVLLSAHLPAPNSKQRRGQAWEVFKKREEGVLMTLLQHKGTGVQLVAACTHLFWNPKFPDVKALQAEALCSHLALFIEQHQASGRAQGSKVTDMPIVLGGDFNSLPSKRKQDIFDRHIPPTPGGLISGVYALLSQGQLPPTHADHPVSRQRSRDGEEDPGPARSLSCNGLQLSSMYHMAHGREPILTTRTNQFAGCLDYVWLTPHFFEVTQTLQLPYQCPEQDSDWQDPLTDLDFPAMPNAQWPSDHMAIGGTISIRPNRGTAKV